MTTRTHSRGPVEPEHLSPDNRGTRIISYILLGLFGLGLVVTALFVFDTARGATPAAKDKASQAIAALEKAGLRAPTQRQLANALGEDGGAVCANPTSALNQGMARLSTSNGAGGPGQRPVDFARRLVEGERILIQVYCPSHLAEFDTFINSHTYSNVA
jgi:hypothetical protein